MKIQKFDNSLEFSAQLSMYPSILKTHCGTKTSFPNDFSTYYGFCLSGEVDLVKEDGYAVKIIEGMYFSACGPITISGAGKTFVVERMGYRGLFSCGGPVEKDGRLIYIDNCKSTILISPARLGDPVFNLLVFPPRTKQTMHIHPTVRFGAVFEGSGICNTLKENYKLSENSIFMIEPGEQHCFETGDSTMAVIAYHPDSDLGPTDSSHPMLSRTYLTK